MGAGVWVSGPNTVPLACMPCGGRVPRGWGGAVAWGGWPATVVRGVWCQALSLPRLHVLWSGQPRFRFLFTHIFSCFACYGTVVLPMQVGLQCMVSYVGYISTVARFVTYLFSPCLHLTVLCLLRRFSALRGI